MYRSSTPSPVKSQTVMALGTTARGASLCRRSRAGVLSAGGGNDGTDGPLDAGGSAELNLKLESKSAGHKNKAGRAYGSYE